MKTVVFVFIFLFSVTVIPAQHISIGPTAGFGHTWLSGGDSGFDNEFYPSYNGGLKLVYSTRTNWGFSADVKFSGEGGEKSGAIAGTDYEFAYRANYVRVPVQAIYFFGALGKAVRPKISLGPSLGFLAGGEITQRTDGTETSSMKTKDAFNGFDIGLNGAAGANFRLGGGKWLNTDITYYHGFTNIRDAGPGMRNRNLGINVGVLFPVGGK